MGGKIIKATANNRPLGRLSLLGVGMKTKDELRTLVVLKVMFDFLRSKAVPARPRDLVTPGDDQVGVEWQRLGIGATYPHKMHLPHLYRAHAELLELGLVEDRVADRAKRSEARYVLTPLGEAAAALLNDNWQEWPSPEQLAADARKGQDS